MKVCFKCNVEKELSKFYKHNGMADGHLNKCKLCTKKDTKEREQQLLKDPKWCEKEKEQHRKKYYRLGYKEKHKPSPEKAKKIIDKYRLKYPEKKAAKNRSSHLKAKTKGNHLHHWSYNEEHYKDVIELSVADHSKAHRFMKYDKKTFMYRDLNGRLLNTRELHEDYINKIIKLF